MSHLSPRLLAWGSGSSDLSIFSVFPPQLRSFSRTPPSIFISTTARMFSVSSLLLTLTIRSKWLSNMPLTSSSPVRLDRFSSSVPFQLLAQLTVWIFFSYLYDTLAFFVCLPVPLLVVFFSRLFPSHICKL